MTFQDLRQNAGSPARYVWYIFVMFLWYLLTSAYEIFQPHLPGSMFWSIGYWLAQVFIYPLIVAAVTGGIHARQRGQPDSGIGGVLKIARTQYWRMLWINLFLLALFFAIGIVVTVILVSTGQTSTNSHLLLTYLFIPLSALRVFWVVTVIVEQRRIGRGFLRAIRLLIVQPYALLVGLLWGALGAGETRLSEILGEQRNLQLLGVKAAILAFGIVLAYAYALAIYKKARVEVFGEAAEDSPVALPPPSAGDRLLKASIILACLAFLPPLPVIGLIVGIMALKRQQRFILRGVIACCVNGFFTAFYLLIVVGLIFASSRPSVIVPGYAFLSEHDARLQPYVQLFEQGNFAEAGKQLELAASEIGQSWSFYCASAIAKMNSYRGDDALNDFRLSLEQSPQRSEVHYYYGKALLNQNLFPEAAAQFQQALSYDTPLEDAQRLLTLAQNVYTPSRPVSWVWSIVILLLLFTLHEYAHAFAAWKLGDDTAKNAGRLTLNPIPHLDLFGSLLLPGLLMWRQSDVVFGWAKPVPVNPERFANPRKDHMVVAFAGPGMNLMVAMLGFIFLGVVLLLVRILWPETHALNLATPGAAISIAGPPFAPWLIRVIAFVRQVLYTSLVLGCFNLIPTPPLDGSWIFSGILPSGAQVMFEKLRPYGTLIFLVLVMTPALDYVLMVPLGVVWGLLSACFWAMGLGV